ncbi:MAG: HD domain-containing protein [Candidatus Krumholzibacteriia bacterium]
MRKPAEPRVISMRLLLSLSTVAMLAVTMTAVFGVTERNSRRALQQELETRLLLEARHLALLSSDALLTDFPELTLCPIVTEMLQDRPELAMAVVVDHDGNVQGHPDVRQLGQPIAQLGRFTRYETRVRLNAGEELLLSDHLLAAQVPARHAGGQVVGSVLVAENRGHIDAVLARTRKQVALVAAVLLLFGAALALVAVQRLLAPLATIREGLRRIGDGDLDTPIAFRSRTELGLLASTINTMADQIKRSQKIARAREREVIKTQSEVIHTLGEVVENRSQETGGHIDRVAEGAALLARLAGLPRPQCELLRMAAPMHDVGKIAIGDAILHKPGKLSDEEFATMQTHASIGADILSQSERPIFRAAAVIAGHHHERWDGRGYPNQLAGEDIHIFGRIVSIVDVFDALTSDRCYRPAMPLEKALGIMQEGRGTQFDPELLDLFMAHFGEFARLTEVINRERETPVDCSEVTGKQQPEPETVTV